LSNTLVKIGGAPGADDWVEQCGLGVNLGHSV